MPTWTETELAEFKARAAKRQSYAPTLPTAAQTAGGEIVGVKRPKATGSALESKFATWWKTCGGPPLETQFKFHTARRWRFDFVHAATKTAIEVEGGSFGFGLPCKACGQRKQGGHNRGKHFAEDCEKYNTAIRLGWVVFRLTGDMITVENLKEIIGFVQWRTGGII